MTQPNTTAINTTVAMTQVVKSMRATFIGGPDSGKTRQECWHATSIDGLWSYERVEDEGTTWYVTHNPSGYTGDQPYGTLTSARRATHSGAALVQMIQECTEIADNEQWPAHVRKDAERSLARLG